MIGVSPVAIGVFGLAPAFRSRLDERRASVGACQGQRRDAKVVRRVRVGASADQQVGCLEIVPMRGPEERRRAIIRSGIDVDALIQQGANLCWSWFLAASTSRRSPLQPRLREPPAASSERPRQGDRLPLSRMPFPRSRSMSCSKVVLRNQGNEPRPRIQTPEVGVRSGTRLPGLSPSAPDS